MRLGGRQVSAAASRMSGASQAEPSRWSTIAPAGSLPLIAGPTITASQRLSNLPITSPQPLAISPSSSSGRPNTAISGIATPSAIAADSTVATRTLPAPALSAASAVRRMPPGTVRAPPITTTRPRSFLSASLSGSGRG
jgi:hypothetical protein